MIKKSENHTPEHMSQQGIFSIAPDGQAANPNGTRADGGNGSPFTSVSNETPQESPFTVAQSPFQQAQPADVSGRNANSSGIPQRRPEGQPPALGGGTVETEAPAPVQQAEEANVFTAASSNASSAGGAFQMNGFPANAGSQVMEAAPAAPAQEASPFVAVQNDHANYEAAKAGLEPQQDFAAVQQSKPMQAYRSTPSAESVQQPVQQSQSVYTRQPEAQQAPVQASVQAPVAQVAQAPEAPAFQQLELRAIFGVDHVLDVSQILQRARTLPGIRNVAVVGQQEASALSNFRQAMQGMGFGNSNDMKLNSGGGSIDFLSEGDTTVAVLLEGDYAPGVQETLIIVAREIGKLA